MGPGILLLLTSKNGAEGAHLFEALLLTFSLDEHTAASMIAL